MAMGKSRECPRRGLQPSYWLINPLIGQQPILVVYPHVDCWLKHLQIGLQLLLILRPSYWLKCQTPSDWSTAHPSPITLLLHNTHSDWSTAHPSLLTLLLAYIPSDWSIAPPHLKTLLLAQMSNTLWLVNSSFYSYYPLIA